MRRKDRSLTSIIRPGGRENKAAMSICLNKIFKVVTCEVVGLADIHGCEACEVVNLWRSPSNAEIWEHFDELCVTLEIMRTRMRIMLYFFFQL